MSGCIELGVYFCYRGIRTFAKSTAAKKEYQNCTAFRFLLIAVIDKVLLSHLLEPLFSYLV